MTLNSFWKTGLRALEDYAKATYGNTIESLSSDQITIVLTDLYNAKPTDFPINPLDFFWEVLFLVWSGFFMDPVYGGNQNMAGWKLTGFTAANMGNAYGEELSPLTLMVASSPTRLQPSSLGNYQKSLGLIGEK